MSGTKVYSGLSLVIVGMFLKGVMRYMDLGFSRDDAVANTYRDMMEIHEIALRAHERFARDYDGGC